MLDRDAAPGRQAKLGQASVQADVIKSADVGRMLDRAYELWGRLDVLLNNAGIAEARSLFDINEAEWDRMLAINLRAVFFVLQGAAKRMRE